MPTPTRIQRLKAEQLCASFEPGTRVLLRESYSDDSPWKTATLPAICERRPFDPEREHWRETVSVRFADDTERLFEPQDEVEIGWVD